MLREGPPKRLGAETSLIFDDFKIKYQEKEQREERTPSTCQLCSLSQPGALSQPQLLGVSQPN